LAGLEKRPGVFLDRDGTLNVRPPKHRYISTVEEFKWLPGAPEAVALLASQGYFLAVVSNQRGVALGATSEFTLRAIESRIQGRLRELGCEIDAFCYCVHDLSAHCSCRKPAPGLLLGIADDYGVDLSGSWMIGDDEVDVRAGRAAGCRTALIGGDQGTADVVGNSLWDLTVMLTH
jgi:D-glycero-D-manno-heptose 1,7-bisphosphate phosphatase